MKAIKCSSFLLEISTSSPCKSHFMKTTSFPNAKEGLERRSFLSCKSGWFDAIKWIITLTLQCLMSTKRPLALKQTCSFYLQFWLVMCDLLVGNRNLRVKPIISYTRIIFSPFCSTSEKCYEGFSEVYNISQSPGKKRGGWP